MGVVKHQPRPSIFEEKASMKNSNARPRRKKQATPATESSQRGPLSLKWLLLIGAVVCIGAVFYRSAVSVDYTGPKFADSERGAQKRSREDKASTSPSPSPYPDTASQERTETIDESTLTHGTSTCEELTEGAQKLLQSSKERDLELALDMLATCILKEESNAGARWNLAAALLEADRTSEALNFIDQALTLDPTNTRYLYEGGMVMSRLNLNDKAIKCWETYLEIILSVPDWGALLATISNQREDEWDFLKDVENVEEFLEMLLNAYLRHHSFVKSSYLYRVLIGLRGLESSHQLIGRYAFYAFSIGDLSNGIGYLQYLTEQNYVSVGYGSIDRAREVITAHALRLLTGGIDSNIVGITRNILIAGQSAWEELVYYCDARGKDLDFSSNVSLVLVREAIAQCFISQELVTKLIERGAAVHAENMFGWTPLLQVISLDNPTILHQILKGRADPQARTAMGLTGLHIAAIKGSKNVVLPLLQAGLKADTKDALNRTAMDLACLHRWYAEEFASALKISKPYGCPVKPQYLPPLKGGFKPGGWLKSSIKLPKRLTTEGCDIDVIGYNANTEELIAHYMSISLPVLIRNASNSHVMSRLFHMWQRGKMEREYGDMVLNEALVPYAEAFGYNETIRTTLRSFLAKMAANSEEQAQARDIMDLLPPSYVFQTLPEHSPILEHFKIPSVLDPTQTEITTDKIQFYVGGTLSGAPPHFHRSAWNFLVYGKKRWFIFPPKDSFYSKEHVWDWWKDWYQNGNGKRTWECVQYPGDLMVLPDMWSHAVINLQESVGVASEFVYGSSEFSL